MSLTDQGHIWRLGFARGEMTAELFRDVPDALTDLRKLGIKTYIYSSGSRDAQRLFFGNTQVGTFVTFPLQSMIVPMNQ